MTAAAFRHSTAKRQKIKKGGICVVTYCFAVIELWWLVVMSW